MSAVVDGTTANPHARSGGRVLLVVASAASIALALFVLALGDLDSRPFGMAPGADPQQSANLYLPLVVAWFVAAAVASVGALLARRRPRTSALLALAALAIGIAAPLLLTPSSEGSLPVVGGLVIWLVPAVALLLGLIAVWPSSRRGGV
jgi:hypothetical protein